MNLIESHQDKMKRIYEAVYFITKKRGPCVLRYDVKDQLDQSTEMLVIRNAVMQMKIEMDIPAIDIQKEIGWNSKQYHQELHRTESLSNKIFWWLKMDCFQSWNSRRAL